MKIDDMPYTPHHTAEDIERAKAWLVDNKNDFEKVSNFAIFTSSEKKAVHSYINQACHYNISVHPGEGATVVATEFPDNISVKRRRPYLNWMLKDTYFSKFILNRDDPEFCLNYGFIVSTDIPCPLLQNIMITARASREVRPEVFDMFNKLVSEGINPDVAYLCCVNTGYGATVFNEASAVRNHGNHRALPLLSLDGISLMTRHEFSDKITFHADKTYRKSSQGFNGGYSMFGSACPYEGNFITDMMSEKTFPMSSEFKDDLAKFRGYGNSGEMYRPPNPFKKPDRSVLQPRHDEVTYKELFEFVLPWCRDHGVFDFEKERNA